MLDSWLEILSALSHNKLRAFLTACGVFWGVFLLIVMLGLGRGFKHGTEGNLGGIVTPSVYVWSQRTTRPYRGLKPGRGVRFRNDDIEALKQLPGVGAVAPRLRLGGWRDGDRVVYGTKTGVFSVMGDYPEFIRVEPMELKSGRFLDALDQSEARKVAVIGTEARKVLMGDKSPIGEHLQIRGIFFQIVGELTSDKSGEEGDRVRSSVFVPFRTFQNAFNQRDRVGWFAILVSDRASPEQFEKAVRQTLIQRHRIHPEDSQAIGSYNSAEKYNQLQSLFRGIENFVWFVGTLTLLAGMLGVSNILLITVKERTKEFGIRKALGAKPVDIVLMVLKEAVALTSISGYLGIVSGVAVLGVLDRILSTIEGAPFARPEVDFRAAIAATAILVFSGVAAGVMPARHATRISPVEALRAE